MPEQVEAELDYLASQHLGRLATAAADGTLQVNPVGFEVDAASGAIDIHGYRMSRSRKFHNVADNGRVAFVVDDIASVDPWRVRCIEIRGHAEALPSPADPATGRDGATIRIHPERIISFGIEEPDVEPHLLTANARDVGTP
jgi:pyridoxamine 5'-phosphate oxidase family protein